MKTAILLLTWVLPWLIQAQPPTSLEATVEPIVRPYLQDQASRALVVGILYEGQPHFFVYGETQKGSGQTPTAQSLFEIGPVTEGFTTALLADQVRQGHLQMDDSLARFFPQGFRLPSYPYAACQPANLPLVNGLLPKPLYACEPLAEHPTVPMRLCDLASQTAGLPTLDRLHFWRRRNPYARYSTNDLYKLLQGYQFTGPHYPAYQYSPLHMALLGHVLALHAQKPYEQLLVETLCIPLHLRDTRITLTPEQRRRRLPGHTQRGKPTPYWTYDALAPTGALYSTPQDLLQWVAVQVGLTQDHWFFTLAMTHQPTYTVTSSTKTGLGWWVTPLKPDSKEMVERYGQTGGFSCYVGFEKISRSGVVIVANTARPTQAMGQAILQSLLQHPLAAERSGDN